MANYLVYMLQKAGIGEYYCINRDAQQYIYTAYPFLHFYKMPQKEQKKLENCKPLSESHIIPSVCIK